MITADSRLQARAVGGRSGSDRPVPCPSASACLSSLACW